MPGRSPHEAVVNFLEPLRRALSVLDTHVFLQLSRRGGYHLDQELAWVLNEGEGAPLAKVGTYYAEMGFRIVEADPARHEGGRFRVTTLRYRYKLAAPDGVDLWRVHWHPDGDSEFKGPHVHLRPDLKLHFGTPRICLEQTVQWCIALGAPLICTESEASARLADTQWTHELYRSWSSSPDERTRSAPSSG